MSSKSVKKSNVVPLMHEPNCPAQQQHKIDFSHSLFDYWSHDFGPYDNKTIVVVYLFFADGTMISDVSIRQFVLALWLD